MGVVGQVLYLIVFTGAVFGMIYCFNRSRKAALIVLLVSPIYLVIAHFISPYIDWRGKFHGAVAFARQMGFSWDHAVMVGYLFHFIFFWTVFFGLSALTFKFLRARAQGYRLIDDERKISDGDGM